MVSSRRVALASALLVLAEAPAGAVPVGPTFKVVRSGALAPMGFHYYLDADCRSPGPVTINLVTPPRYGEVSEGPRFAHPSYRSGDQLAACNRIMVRGLEVYYRSSPGYTGPDSYVVECVPQRRRAALPHRRFGPMKAAAAIAGGSCGTSSDGTPHPCVIRQLRPEDASAIEALYASCMAVEAGIGPVTAEDWSRAITLPQFGGGREFLVAERDGRVVGLGESSPRGHDGRRMRHLKLVVDPTFRRIGIATSLLGAVLAQDRDDVPVTVQGNAPSHWTAGLAFLERYGFTRIQSEIKMRCETSLPAFPVPAGIEVVRAAPSAAGTARLADLHNAAFRDDAGFSWQTPDDAARHVEDGHLWVARLGGDVVGYALVDSEPALSWLETVAVDPALQGRGIGTALVAEALRGEGVGAGCAGGLSVSSVNGTAVRIYGRLGFVSRSEVGKYAVARADLLTRMPAAS